MGKPDEIREYLPAHQNLPTKEMKYGAQVVWCIDPGDADMMFIANALYGKRVAAGDADKTALVTGQRPQWPTVPATEDTRLYVCAHGVKVSGATPLQVKIALGTPLDTQSKTASEFLPFLQEFVQHSPTKRVRRISLAVCNGGGIAGRIAPVHSFAQQLADLSAGLTTDVVGRCGEVAAKGVFFPKADVDGLYNPAPNPLHTIMLERQGTVSVVNARKQVEGVYRSRTYVFTAGTEPRLKSGYSE